jgi:hypothetical protein
MRMVVIGCGDRFITEVYDELKDFPPVVDGKRAMPSRE